MTNTPATAQTLSATEVQRVLAAAARCARVEENSRNGDVCWISRVYDRTWNPDAESDWDTDKRLCAAALPAALRRIAALEQAVERARTKLREIVCTEPPDDGVVLLSGESPCHPDPATGISTYDHAHFSPLWLLPIR